MYLDIHLFHIFCTYDYTNFILRSYVLNTLGFQIILQAISDFYSPHFIWETTLIFFRTGFCNLRIVGSIKLKFKSQSLKNSALSQVLIGVFTGFNPPNLGKDQLELLNFVYGFKIKKTILMHRRSVVPFLIAASSLINLKLVMVLIFCFQIPQGRTYWRALFECVTLLQEDHSRIVILLCTSFS